MRAIYPAGGPAPNAAYVPGIRVGQLVFVSGQGPYDPATGELTTRDVEGQVRSTLSNLVRVLDAAGASLRDVVRIDAYLADLADFNTYDVVFREVFDGHFPTRTTVEARIGSAQPIRVEISAIAYLASHEPALGNDAMS